MNLLKPFLRVLNNIMKNKLIDYHESVEINEQVKIWEYHRIDFVEIY